MSSLSLYERSDLLERMRRLHSRDAEEFAHLICCEEGKPIREARVEAEPSQQALIASTDTVRHLRGEVVPMDAAPTGKGRWAMTVREPLGIIGAIIPLPYGGIKKSGVGREGPRYVVEEMTELKLICWRG